MTEKLDLDLLMLEIKAEQEGIMSILPKVKAPNGIWLSFCRYFSLCPRCGKKFKRSYPWQEYCGCGAISQTDTRYLG